MLGEKEKRRKGKKKERRKEDRIQMKRTKEFYRERGVAVEWVRR